MVGTLAARDVMPRVLAGQAIDLAALLREPLFVPARLPAYRALDQFKQASSRMALVVDEGGGVDGVLTATDLLEVLAGATPGTGNGHGRDPVRRKNGSWLFDGLMPVHDAAELLGVRPELSEAEDVLTLGGLAMERIGRVPVAGDRFVWQGVQFEVVDMDRRRVDKLLAAPRGTTL